MAGVNIILGIFLIIGGISCMVTPFATFLSTGYYVAIILMVYGINGIIRAFQKKSSTMEIIVSVLAILFGLYAIIRPGNILAFDAMAIYLVAIWYILQGVSSLITAIQVKDTNKNWIWGLCSGILGILLGLYSFAHPGVTAITTGMLIGLYFIIAGVGLLSAGVANPDK
ncbi:MAG: DUF308 domain-containing protein [Solobacterium sp.]|nr:DUF308 domain-containing protein [Solobacterium sp.]